MKQETSIEEIAERIADNYVPYRSDWRDRKRMKADILAALRNEREACAKIADNVENKWIENARNVARADDLVGSLAQLTYTYYAEIANGIAAAIRERG